MSSKQMPTASAQKAQDEADGGGLNPADERAAQKQSDHTGEPQRDKLGNEDGAS